MHTRLPWALLAAAFALALPSSAAAATITVTTTTDESTDNTTCSLREAVESANRNSNSHENACTQGEPVVSDVVALPAGIYTLSGAASDDDNVSGDLDVENYDTTPSSPSYDNAGADVTLDGAGDSGAGATVIDANGIDRAIDVQSDALSSIDVTLEDLTIRNGNVSGPSDDGGAVIVRDSDGGVSVRDSTIENSHAGHYGGAISFDDATSGGSPPIVVLRSELVGNSADEGGAIWTDNQGGAGSAEVLQSTLTGNSASEVGGAIYLAGSPDTSGVKLLNTTIHGNTATDGGGAVGFGAAYAHLYVYFSTITGNSTSTAGRGGGIQTDADGNSQKVFFRGAILAGNTAAGAAANCARVGGPFSLNVNTNGFNIEDANTCALDFDLSNDVNTDPKLAPLQDNGGETRTRALYTGSPAIDQVPTIAPNNFCSDYAGPPGNALTIDQRGAARPASPGLCDIGAFEGSVAMPPTDTDGDGVADPSDNCPSSSNSDQGNNDGDSEGDACDGDDDNDSAADASDNCPLSANADQANTDGDSEGDTCDGDDDNDSRADGSDNCPLLGNADQTDTDGDGAGNACDLDDDNDLRADVEDVCELLTATGTSGCPAVRPRVTLRYSSRRTRFSGRVTASNRACAAGRRVTIYKRRTGRSPSRVRRTTTRADGSFRVERTANAGRYYALVAAAVVPDEAACSQARSRTLTVR